jgi:hypothetical protein
MCLLDAPLLLLYQQQQVLCLVLESFVGGIVLSLLAHAPIVHSVTAEEIRLACFEPDLCRRGAQKCQMLVYTGRALVHTLGEVGGDLVLAPQVTPGGGTAGYWRRAECGGQPGQDI